MGSQVSLWRQLTQNKKLFILSGSLLMMSGVLWGKGINIFPWQTPKGHHHGKATVAAPLAKEDKAEAPALPYNANPYEMARELIHVSGMARSFTATIPQFEDKIYQNITQTRPELASILKEVLSNLKPKYLLKVDDVIASAAKVYIKFLTPAELHALVQFFQTPIGRKYVMIQPALLDQVLSITHEWTQKMSSEMFAAVRNEMQRKGYNI